MKPSVLVAAIAAAISLSSIASLAQQSTTTKFDPAPAVTNTAVTTPGGTNGLVPVFTGASTIANSLLYYNAGGLGVGHFPAAPLDVLGKSIFRGAQVLSRSGDATAAVGDPSFGLIMQSSVYNSNNKGALLPYFQLQSEPTGNNTTTTGATFNFLYYTGVGSTVSETGLYFNSNGTIHFAPGQTFPITTGATGPAGPQGPTGPQGPVGPQGPAGPIGSVPANLSAISADLSTTSGVAYLGATKFSYPGTCVIGDVFLSVNGYSGNALPADGRLVPISNNTALFSLIGTNFGGNGTSNYAVPDLRAFAPKGLQYSICLNGIFPPVN